jgi:hypothetical protein
VLLLPLELELPSEPPQAASISAARVTRRGRDMVSASSKVFRPQRFALYLFFELAWQRALREVPATRPGRLGGARRG